MSAKKNLKKLPAEQVHVAKYFCVVGFMKNREPVEICPTVVLELPPGVKARVGQKYDSPTIGRLSVIEILPWLFISPKRRTEREKERSKEARKEEEEDLVAVCMK